MRGGTEDKRGHNWRHWVRGTAIAAGFAAGVILMLLILAGKFTSKVPTQPRRGPGPVAQDQPTAPARWLVQPRTEAATGSIRAVYEASISAKIMAVVTEVNLKAGQDVQAGEVLVRLDDTDLQQRLKQAQAAVAAAQARLAQATLDEAKLRELMKVNAATPREYDKALAILHAAQAEVRQAEEAANEAGTMIGYAVIRAPITGRVIDKKIDVGAMVGPGEVLLTIFDPQRMQLIASVRESLAMRLRVGQELGVRIDALNKQCVGTISEIVPEAQTASRSFQVKVTGPCPPDLYTGMFGRILIPLGEEKILVIPRAAVRRVGQLELVDVRTDAGASARAIRTGRVLDGDVEVLAGLTAGEKVVVHE